MINIIFLLINSIIICIMQWLSSGSWVFWYFYNYCFSFWLLFKILNAQVRQKDSFLPAIAEENLWILVNFYKIQITLTFSGSCLVSLCVSACTPPMHSTIKKKHTGKVVNISLDSRNKLWDALKYSFKIVLIRLERC